MTDKNEQYDIGAAQRCIQNSLELVSQTRAKGKASHTAKESNIRHSFSSYLRLIFPEAPWWVEDHISRGEANTAFSIGGEDRHGFVDNLVGSTAIEYESDLTNPAKFSEGFGQVKNYCASLINSGCDPDLVIGVLSDTIRWRAYKIKSVQTLSGTLGGEHLELEEIDQIDLSSSDEIAARKLIGFLFKHLGRRGSRPLNAGTIARDLGLESTFCADHADALSDLVDSAFAHNPKYADLITNLWCNFVTYLRDKGSTATFERSGYASELYILTLAKLICANVIEKTALLSDDAQLAAILDGRYFESKGLVNLVEYDYFGWLNQPPFIQTLLPIARGVQADLEAYDFSSPPAEDLFGRMMAQLAKRTQRLLLGQEWTPSWLANELVKNVCAKLPAGVNPQLVDMCCGSGAMIVEAVKQTKDLLALTGTSLPPEERIQRLSQAITGFDIDPLAVLLSKISWVLAARDWLEPFNGAIRVSIPVYHADSLFAATPLSGAVEENNGSEFHKLQIAEYLIDLPSFLVSPQFQPLFDALLDRAYGMAMAAAKRAELLLSDSAVDAALQSTQDDSGCKISSEKMTVTGMFLRKLIETVDALNRDGRNGIWIFILRNSYRPGLVAGQFNGLVSNPPWLALSKIADNPYKDSLQKRAIGFGIKPTGPSHLHIELATIFLLHAIDRYLRSDAVIGCIVPDTVLNGHHHNPFRIGAYASATHPVDFAVHGIWRVKNGTFKNEACVLFGSKIPYSATEPDPIPGGLATEDGITKAQFERIQRGSRIIWSDTGTVPTGKAGFFNPAAFRQGADIMPRALLFHEMDVQQLSGGRVHWTVGPIDSATSRVRFAVKDAKKNKGFQITPRTVPDKVVFDVLTSTLLTPFEMGEPIKALLPIEKNGNGKWMPVDQVELDAIPQARAAFDEILEAFEPGSTLQDLFRALDSDRHKLTQQSIPNTGFLVFTGAGGKLVCSAYAPVTQFNVDKLIVDQTLYWAPVNTEDEAVYLTGLFNSEAVNAVIQEFQPRGAFGERHIHTLAHEVTPPFDPTQVAHQEVVQATRMVLGEYAAAKGIDNELRRMLDPNASKLDVRRRKIRDKLRNLPSYAAYEQACRELYGL